MQTNPVKAIREKCLDCCCWSANEVKMCPDEKCALHPFRFGKNPYRAERSEAQKAATAKLTERRLTKKTNQAHA